MHRGYVSSIAAAGGAPVLLPAGSDADPYALCAAVDHCQAHGGHRRWRRRPPSLRRAPSSAAPDVLMEVDPEPGTSPRSSWSNTPWRRASVCWGSAAARNCWPSWAGARSICDLGEKGLDGHWDEERQYEPVHAVHSEPGSVAARILGSVDQVNSIHHQAIADPGQTLRATAWSPDGVIEAVEGPGAPRGAVAPRAIDGRRTRATWRPFAWVVRG